jgi:exopolysaccharide biosynthesis predicted pyruvyltransferase EpsI
VAERIGVALKVGEHHARLRQRAQTVLRELVAPGNRCALVDFPTHFNVGDSAMWLGERALLREARVSIADLQSFLEDELAERLPKGTILLHGGGNLGDLWPDHQQLRERIINAFPRHRITSFRSPSTSASVQTWSGRGPSSTRIPTSRCWYATTEASKLPARSSRLAAC